MPSRTGMYDSRYEHDACGVGFVADLKGGRSHRLVRQGVQILRNLEHRGACGCEDNTGDGAGLLLQLPDRFFREVASDRGVDLPEAGFYGVGVFFLPADPQERARCREWFEGIVEEEGQRFLGWRQVPTFNASLGKTALTAEPVIEQALVGRGAGVRDSEAFERKLYVVRRRIENAVRASRLRQREMFCVPSLSSRTLVYKGMLTPWQLEEYYPDLSNPLVESGLVMVHSRFSTNTFPSWSRAHPYRYLCHNGEINTLRGNVNWMKARQTLFESPLFGEDMAKVLPVVDEEGSDSGMFDNALEFLVLAGRDLPHVVMMLIPEPWSGHRTMSEEKRAFYEYHSCLMEPWDGPASIAFTDGTQIGAVLDRNGLRPSRYYVTADGLVVMASEVGVLDIPPDRVVEKGRLQPGRMFLVDTREGRIVADEEIKHRISTEKPYRVWLDRHLVDLADLADPPRLESTDSRTLRRRQRVFGYTDEELKIVMAAMAETANEAVGSMGNDAPLAVLSDRPQLLYNYFKQLFAQVTNPPVDSIREELIMSVEIAIGPERNLLDPAPESARQIKLKSPILTNVELEKLRHVARTDPRGNGRGRGFKARTLSMLFRAGGEGEELEEAMQELCRQASRAIAEGVEILILSDRGVNEEQTPIPALLAVAGVHHHLIREGTRTRVGLVVESGEPREVHHFALLIGYGAGAVNPYLVFETLDSLAEAGLLSVPDAGTAHKNFVKAANKGVTKVMSKMGISTIQSYHGAQIFEAIGLDPEVVDRYFTWTASRVRGIGLDVIAREALMRHREAYSARKGSTSDLEGRGEYQWRQGGEHHLFNPQTVHKLQIACRTDDYQTYLQYSELINNQEKKLSTLRGLFRFRFPERPVPIEEVEPVESIVRRFKTGAMSYGSISKEAHEALAVAMNRIGGKSNTGEGGEASDRYSPDPNGDSRNSAIKQVASGRFGVTSEYLVNARELQIKMAQGAKPGEGGQLPGHKVYPEIARVRYSTPGVGLISPPPHHDIYSIEDLAQLIHDLKNANSEARISVKLVAEVGVGTVAAGVAKARADVVLISGHDGGTGASPLTSIKHAGIPWELGLAETHQVLVLNDLRSRIRVEVDGQLKTGRDVVIAALLGGEEFGFATAPLVAMGCLMMRVCHLNTCPVGIATQDPRLREKFTGAPDHVVNFMLFVAQEARELMARLGFRSVDEMVGRTDRLEMVPDVNHWKARNLDFSRILHQPEVGPEVGRYATVEQDHGLEKSLDRKRLLEVCSPALERGHPVSAHLPIRNTDRVVGTIVGSEITRRYGARGLPDDTIRLHFTGSAGQSFGAFLPRGMTLILEGDSNDYLGKGLSGGRIIVFPRRESTFEPQENVIIGNVAFYGATAGEAYISGVAGERFCVRNSGVTAVVEAVGDHGCEYMTGGAVVVLGPTGRNFAAGMSGGVAYVLDEDSNFEIHCNLSMVGLYPLEDAHEASTVRELVRRHAELTGSRRAWQVLSSWEELMPRFVKVYPHDYRRVLEAQERLRGTGLSEEAVAMAAFEENSRDLARVGGG